MEHAVQGFDILPALRAVADVNDALAEIAGDLCEIAARDTKLTQKQLADALRVPPSTLRGLKASVRA